MNKIYTFISKKMMKLKIPYTMNNKRYYSYNYKQKPDCEFCDNLLFFGLGMWCGYMISKDRGQPF